MTPSVGGTSPTPSLIVWFAVTLVFVAVESAIEVTVTVAYGLTFPERGNLVNAGGEPSHPRDLYSPD